MTKLTEWRVGYISSHVEEMTAIQFEWRSSGEEELAHARFKEYKAKYWDKELINALMLVRHDFDPMAGVYTTTVLESMQKKLTPTVHYNKKDGLAKAKAKVGFTQGSLVDVIINSAPNPSLQQAVQPVSMEFFEQFYNSQAMGTTNP